MDESTSYPPLNITIAGITDQRLLMIKFSASSTIPTLERSNALMLIAPSPTSLGVSFFAMVKGNFHATKATTKYIPLTTKSSVFSLAMSLIDRKDKVVEIASKNNKMAKMRCSSASRSGTDLCITGLPIWSKNTGLNTAWIDRKTLTYQEIQHG